MKKLKKLIEDNFFIKVHRDRNTLWIEMENQNKNISIDKDENGFYVSSGNESYMCENDETVIYFLLKYCKDKHRWGEFDNKN